MFFELHIHTRYSDGYSKVGEILDYARSHGISGVAFTDHDSIRAGLEAKALAEGVEVIAGVEVSSKQGHILALDVGQDIQKGLSARESVERIHELGGVAVAAHPYDALRRGVGDLILDLDFDAVETVNGHTFKNTKDPGKVCEQAGLPVMGGSDAHIAYEVGSVKVGFEGDWRKALCSNKMRIVSKPKTTLVLNHVRGAVRRRGPIQIMSKGLKKLGL